jgi:hypothetical protein
MEFKIKKMTVKDSREIKNEIEDCIKIAEEKNMQVGSILNEKSRRLKEINLNVKKKQQNNIENCLIINCL